ncbi:MAG: hypothetical protein C0429_06330 [Sphingopyxis sp.]|nr:hypothetical protein [Sphingopyxis sp.]
MASGAVRGNNSGNKLRYILRIGGNRLRWPPANIFVHGIRLMNKAHRFALLALSPSLLAFPVPATAQMPVPPPVEQSTADCARPVYASDQLVCSDPELRQLDAELAAKSRVPAAWSGSALIESDGQWFKRRSHCAFESDHRICLLQSYRDRLSFLESATQTRDQMAVASCAMWGLVEIDRMPNGYRIVRTRQNQALKAIAAPASGQSIWKPVWAAESRPSSIDFKSYDGRRISCKVKR